MSQLFVIIMTKIGMISLGYGDVLYKRNHDSALLRCVDIHEVDKIIKDIHEGSFGTHSSGHAMAKKDFESTLLLDDYGD